MAPKAISKTVERQGAIGDTNLEPEPMPRDGNADRPTAKPATLEPPIAIEPTQPAPPRDDTRARETQIALGPAMEQARVEIRQAIALASKGAIFSARRKLESILQDLSRSLDNQRATRSHQENLGLALLALREAPDFTLPAGSAPSQLDVESIVARHRSTVLKPASNGPPAPDEAMQRYLGFTEDQLVAAAGGLPAVSEALFALGKLHMIQAEQSSSLRRANSMSAIAMFRAAVRVDERNHLAANELGVLLARDGRLHEARDALQTSIAAHPLPDTWRNLAVVHQRLGDQSRAIMSLAEWQRAVERTQRTAAHPVVASNGSVVHWVDKATFETGSLGVTR